MMPAVMLQDSLTMPAPRTRTPALSPIRSQGTKGAYPLDPRDPPRDPPLDPLLQGLEDVQNKYGRNSDEELDYLRRTGESLANGDEPISSATAQKMLKRYYSSLKHKTHVTEKNDALIIHAPALTAFLEKTQFSDPVLDDLMRTHTRVVMDLCTSLYAKDDLWKSGGRAYRIGQLNMVAMGAKFITLTTTLTEWNPQNSTFSDPRYALVTDDGNPRKDLSRAFSPNSDDPSAAFYDGAIYFAHYQDIDATLDRILSAQTLSHEGGHDLVADWKKHPTANNKQDIRLKDLSDCILNLYVEALKNNPDKAEEIAPCLQMIRQARPEERIVTEKENRTDPLYATSVTAYPEAKKGVLLHFKTSAQETAGIVAKKENGMLKTPEAIKTADTTRPVAAKDDVLPHFKTSAQETPQSVQELPLSADQRKTAQDICAPPPVVIAEENPTFAPATEITAAITFSEKENLTLSHREQSIEHMIEHMAEQRAEHAAERTEQTAAAHPSSYDTFANKSISSSIVPRETIEAYCRILDQNPMFAPLVKALQETVFEPYKNTMHHFNTCTVS